MIYPEAMETRCILPWCNQVITYRFAMCSYHYEIYGSRPEEWVENGHGWLREMWNSKQRKRRVVTKSKRREMSIEFFEEEFPYLK